jgi:hypothetical protein
VGALCGWEARQSSISTRFLWWCCQRLQAAGKRVWVLIWENASWHICKEVTEWIASHNRKVKNSGQGVRIISCLLPKKSPWLQSSAPRSVLCLGIAVRPPPVKSFRELLSLSAICSTESAPILAAASSMASGMPSNLRQICVIAPMLSGVTSKSGDRNRVRSTKSRAAS